MIPHINSVLTVVFGLIMLQTSCRSEEMTLTPVPSQTTQMVMVITGSDTATTGHLFCFERGNSELPWKPVNNPVAVIVGGNGLAWGSGLHSMTEEMKPLKREGDMKSPAGVFTLDAVFGFAPQPADSNFSMPYIPIDEMTECIDDVKSAYYNRVLERDSIDPPDWQSSEIMIRAVPDYHLGVVVGHNSNPVVPGRGSCIFLHIWSDPGGVTYGCTAMASGDMESLAGWLDQARYPILEQLTAENYQHLKDSWHLPEIENK